MFAGAFVTYVPPIQFLDEPEIRRKFTILNRKPSYRKIIPNNVTFDSPQTFWLIFYGTHKVAYWSSLMSF